MYIGVLSPQRDLPLLRRISLEDRPDRLARGHPRAKPRGHVVERQAPTRGASAASAGRRETRPARRSAGAGGPAGARSTTRRAPRSGCCGRASPAAASFPSAGRRGREAAARSPRRPDAHDRPIGVPARLDEERERARRAGGAQHEEPGLGGPRCPRRTATRSARASVTRGRRSASPASASMDGPGELDVADPHRSRRRGRRDVPGRSHRDDGDPVRARPKRRAVRARPNQSSVPLSGMSAAQHPLLPVHEQAGACAARTPCSTRGSCRDGRRRRARRRSGSRRDER